MKKKTKKRKKGFTLIELLVVIAVIGILAGIVLVSVRKAPDAAKDARIQSALTQVRDVAQMHYIESQNSFADICNGGLLNTSITDFVPLHDDIALNSGSNEICYSTSSKYCARATLKTTDSVTGNSKYFCVDSTGATVSTATSTSLCEETNYTCAND